MKRLYCSVAVVMFAGVPQAQSLHGAVTDAVTGKPIVGAVVTLAEILKTFTTDSLGRYATDSVGAGTYTVKITARPYLAFSRKAIIASARGAGISDLEFNAGLYNISTVADTSDGTMAVIYQFPGHGDVEFVIQNDRGTTVRKMYDRSRLGGMRKVSWNGKDDDGNSVAEGRYTCKVSSGRLVMVRSLVWKGAAKVAPETVTTPAPAPAVPVQAEETPAAPPSPPAQDTDTTKGSPEDSPEE